MVFIQQIHIKHLWLASYYNKHPSTSVLRENDKKYLTGSVLSASLELTLLNNPMMKLRPRRINNFAMLTLTCELGFKPRMQTPQPTV